MTTIYFDMDGTIADLYGVENWLEYLITSDTFPYEVAKPILRFSYLARLLNQIQKRGYRIGIISWLSKDGTEEYNEAVTAAKERWLKKHLKSVTFDEIHIVAYGTPKQIFSKSNKDILFDDEEKNRINWTGKAYPETEILNILKGI